MKKDKKILQKQLNKSKKISRQAQEEELRQNAEEMQATQEEQERKIRVLENKLNAMEGKHGRLDYDEQGNEIEMKIS